MNLTPLDALITTWTHGTRGFLLAYAVIGVFMIAGLKQGGAREAVSERGVMVIDGTAAQAADAVRSLDYIREGKGRDFSVREWIRSDKGGLFMPY